MPTSPAPRVSLDAAPPTDVPVPHACERHGEAGDPADSRSIAGAVVLSLVHVPCCALPVLALLLGASGAAAPWVGRWAAWAAWTWPLAAVVLAGAWWRLARAHACPTVRRQRRILIGATLVLVASLALGHVGYPALDLAAHAH